MDNKIVQGNFENAPINGDRIRRTWHRGEWHLSVVDFIAELTKSDNPRQYWQNVKRRLANEGNRKRDSLQLKLVAKDGAQRKTEVVTIEEALRIVQSVESPNAEPMKQWLAKVGAERLEEMQNPELGVARASERAVQSYEKRGKSSQWIDARLIGIEARNRFTAALMDVILTTPSNLYLSATEQLYKGLWDRTTAQLRRDLNMPKSGGGNVRDRFGRYALIYTGLVENIVADRLNHSDEITDTMAMEIVWKVAQMIQGQARETAQMLGIDLVTERPLFQVLDNPRLPGA